MALDEEYLDNLLNSMKENPELQEEAESESKLIEDEITDDSSDAEDQEDWKASLDELLANADMAAGESMQSDDQEDIGFNDRLMETEVDDLFNSNEVFEGLDDVTQNIDSTDNFNDDDSVDNDMATLLENVSESAEPEDKKGKKKKEKKKKEKKKKEKKTARNDSLDGNLTTANGEADSNKETEGKTKGGLGRFFEALFAEEDEEEKVEKIDEGDEALKELGLLEPVKEKADEKKKKEKKKKDKKPKEKKQAKPKPVKEKKKKEKPQTPAEPPITIAPKVLVVLIAFCMTILAAVILITVFLTDFAARHNASAAYYAKDYKQVYEILYSRNRTEEEDQIFNQVNGVLQMQRNLDLYEYHKNAGDDARALDALLQGVIKYERLNTGELYGVSDELRSIYQTILEYLSRDYGIGEAEAFEINNSDNEAYSQRVYAIVNGTEAAEDQNENPEAKVPQDILPEEADIINEGMEE